MHSIWEAESKIHTSCTGFNIVDVLVGGTQGHVIGIGAILGLRAMGAL